MCNAERRRALEALLVAAYGQGLLTAAEIQGALGLPSRYDTDAFLKERGAGLDYTGQDLEEDLRAFRQAPGR